MNSSITFKTSLVALEIYFSYLHKFSRLSWYLRLLSLVAIYSGPSTSVEILNYIFTFRGTSHTVNLVFSFFCWLRDKRAMCFPRGSWRGVGEGRSHFPSIVCYEISSWNPIPSGIKKIPLPMIKDMKIPISSTENKQIPVPILPLRTFRFTLQDPSFYPSGPFVLPFRTLHFTLQDPSFYPSGLFHAKYLFPFQLSLFIQVQKELQSFFPRILDQALEKCLKNIATKSSPDALTQVR